MSKKDKREKLFAEYHLLKEKFEEINWALEGNCNDIDCDRYMYKDLLKKKYKPVLEHSFSCVKSLKRDKVAVLRLLSMQRYRKFRNEKCYVCDKLVDKLSDRSTIVSFTRPSSRDEDYTEWKGYWIHKRCKGKLNTPKDWRTAF